MDLGERGARSAKKIPVRAGYGNRFHRTERVRRSRLDRKPIGGVAW